MSACTWKRKKKKDKCDFQEAQLGIVRLLLLILAISKGQGDHRKKKN